MKDPLVQYYTGFSEKFAAAGFGQCGAPKILLPQSVEIEDVQQVIAGKFEFDCTLSFSKVEAAFEYVQESLRDANPRPDIRVTLYDVDDRNRIRLYPRNDIESYLSGS
jgi:predicted amino acid-binding ACT domain protein